MKTQIALIVSLFVLAGCGDLFSTNGSGSKDILVQDITTTDAFMNKAHLEHSKAEARTCVEDVCGSQNLSLYTYEDESFFLNEAEVARLPKARQIFESKIKSKLSSFLDIHFFEMDKSVGQMLEVLEGKKGTVLSESEAGVALKFVKRNFLFEELKDIDGEYFSKSSEGSYIIPSYLSTLEPALVEKLGRAMSVLNLQFSNTMYIAGSLIARNGVLKGAKVAFDEVSSDEAVPHMLEKLDKMISEISEKNKLIGAIFGASSTFKKLKNGVELNSAEEEDFGDWVKSTTSIHLTITGQLDPYLTDKVEVENYFKVDNLIAHMSERKAEMSDEASVKSKRERVEEMCKSSVSLSLASSPLEKDIKAFRQKIPEVKASAIRVSDALLTGKKSKLKNAINGAYFHLPKSRAQNQESILEALDYAIRVTEEMSNIDPRDYPNDALEMMAVISSQSDSASEEEKEKRLFLSVFDECEKFLPENLSDSVTTADGGIVVSRWSINQPKKGLGVLAHEFGHIVYNEFNDEIPDDRKGCLLSRHGRSDSIPIRANGKYVSEDFADHFTGLVLNDLGLTSMKNNMACLFFMSKDIDNGQIFTRDTHPLVNSYQGDVHSSGFFRLLQLGQDLGHLPPSCSSLSSGREAEADVFVTLGSALIPEVKSCNIN